MKFIALIPNALSFLRIILSPIFAWFFMQSSHEQQLIGVCIFMVAALSDTCDGYLARRFNVHSAYGAFLDPLADKILILTALGCLYWQGMLAWWLVAAIVGRDLVVTWLRVRAGKLGKHFTTSWLAKAKTVAQFMALSVGFYAVLWPSPGVDLLVQYLMPGIALFTLYTGYEYVRSFCQR